MTEEEIIEQQEEEFEENENMQTGEYDSKSDFSKAEVVRQQVGAVNSARSKEMKEGYYNTDKLGNRIYVPDSRKEFVSSVKALRTLLEPEVKRDELFLKAEKEILEKIKTSVNTFGVFEMEVEGFKIKPKTDKLKYIPHLGEVIPVLKKIINKQGQCISAEVQYISGVFNRNHHDYWNFIVEMYDDLYSELSSLIDRCKYFKEGISY